VFLLCRGEASSMNFGPLLPLITGLISLAAIVGAIEMGAALVRFGGDSV
jgi:hypothetical protein